MTEAEIQEYLKGRGCRERVWKGGSARLIDRWERFVSRVEQGDTSDWLYPEYWNFLCIREMIHDIGCDSRVIDADRRFASVLTATHIKHSYEDRNSDYDFWNYGYPKNASGYFYEEVKHYILKHR